MVKELIRMLSVLPLLVMLERKAEAGKREGVAEEKEENNDE